MSPVVEDFFGIILPYSVLPNLCLSIKPAGRVMALLMLFLLRLTSFPKDLFALDFVIFSPKAKDLNAVNAALFLFEPESLTLARPLEMSEGNALSVATSLCSSGVVTTPLISSCFLVLGLLTKLSRTAAFLAGEAGRVVFTLSVARFSTSCSEMRRPRPEFLPHCSPVSVFHDIFGLSLLSVL